MKPFFIKLVDKYLEESGVIESRYQIIKNGQYKLTDKLTCKNISEGFIIYEKINL